MAMLVLQMVIKIAIIMLFGSMPASTDEVCESVSADPRPGPPAAMFTSMATNVVYMFDALNISSSGVITEIQYYIDTLKAASSYVGFWRPGSTSNKFTLIGKVKIQPTTTKTLYTQTVDPTTNSIEVQPGDRGGIHGDASDANGYTIAATRSVITGITTNDLKTTYLSATSVGKDNGWATGFEVTLNLDSSNWAIGLSFNVSCPVETTTSTPDTTSTVDTEETTSAQNDSASTHHHVLILMYILPFLVLIM